MMDYKKHVLKLTGGGSLENMLKAVRALEREVVVNIACTQEETPVFFSTENLKLILPKIGDTLTVETLPERAYCQLMRNEIQQIRGATGKLREILRDRFVSDIREHVNGFLNQLENFSDLLNCYALQKPPSTVSGHMKKLFKIHQQLGNSCLVLKDNVRCMDDLQYGVLSLLDPIAEELKRR